MDTLCGLILLGLIYFCSAQTTGYACKPCEEYRENGCEVTCKRILNDTCYGYKGKPGCYCKHPTIRDEAGDCIGPMECSEEVCTKPNTTLDMSGCFYICTKDGTSFSQWCPFLQIPACTCKPGFAFGCKSCVPVCKCTEMTQCEERRHLKFSDRFI